MIKIFRSSSARFSPIDNHFSPQGHLKFSRVPQTRFFPPRDSMGFRKRIPDLFLRVLFVELFCPRRIVFNLLHLDINASVRVALFFFLSCFPSKVFAFCLGVDVPFLVPFGFRLSFVKLFVIPSSPLF